MIAIPCPRCETGQIALGKVVEATCWWCSQYRESVACSSCKMALCPDCLKKAGTKRPETGGKLPFLPGEDEIFEV